MAWLIIRFDCSRWLIYSVGMGITTWVAGMMHFYYLGFFGFLIGGYWLFRFAYYRKASTYWYRDLLHLSIQYIIPLLLLQFRVISLDEATDRPSYPFGYQSSFAHPAGVFLPSGVPWAFVSRILTVFDHIPWESHAYIGTVALAGILAGLFFLFRRISRKEIFHKVNHVKPVNVLFWISVVALLFSFGIPFIFGLKGFFSQVALFRQLRVLARFSWLFFYMINIVVFAALYHKAYVTDQDIKWKIAAVCALILLWTESAFNVNGIAVHLKNRISELEDRQNLLSVNQWVTELNPSDYQAIIPLPGFHIGSENLWSEGTDQSKCNTLIASLKTGLPTTGVILSRTSLSQTFMNDALYKEALQRLELVDFLSDSRPFLVFWMKGYVLSESEAWLIRGCEKVYETDRWTMFALPVSTVKSLHETWRRRIFERYESEIQFQSGNCTVSDSAAYLRQISFDATDCKTPMRGSGAFSFRSGKWCRLYTDTLTGVPKGRRLVIGCWIHSFQEDGTVRGNLEVVHLNKKDGQVKRINTDFFRHLKAYQGEWALVELETETRSDDEILQLSVRNNVIPNAEFVLDELLIREKGTDVWQSGEKYLLYNGRYFQRR